MQQPCREPRGWSLASLATSCGQYELKKKQLIQEGVTAWGLAFAGDCCVFKAWKIDGVTMASAAQSPSTW
ncbi:hypothetical protein K432DRAFT_381108 [Lepidopterella palustris CBS 459.81]|uniref:Uncharacterized protein n=1 Tax=Lepidopterella palustris CBS 459.81 TaxID=1314670 RepID=A0A8E2JGC7_9PEZI|nr:hypothetical protein K432DRAFT_381108 [Lepidopterella palustris CBS 459.81]